MDRMRRTIDYNATMADLGTGDRFQLTQHGDVHTVAWADPSADGSWVYIRTPFDVLHFPSNLLCKVVEEAPRCGCGRRFERCEQDCPVPADIEVLFNVG